MAPDGRKYFFDLNNFDSSAVPEPEEDLPPPPPIFSLEELDAAKQQSFEQGRAVGQQEEQQSRAQYIATQISELNTQILSLILSEQIRENRFEQEVIHLCRTLISKLFPALTQRGGTEEIERVISQVLSKQPASRITIEVPTDDAKDIKSHLLALKDIEPDRLSIVGIDSLGKGSCRMKWQDGGATRDHQSLAASIFAELDAILAPLPQKGDNHKNESEIVSTESQKEDLKGE